jgi:ribonuclease HI
MANSDWERNADFMIAFDGGSQGNPGPAYGSYALVNDKGDVTLERLNFDEPLTNNEAEYHTLLAALRALRQRVSGRIGHVVVVVRGDSQLVINQVSGEWQVKEPRLRPLCDEARQLLAKFKRHKLAWQSREDTVRILGH